MTSSANNLLTSTAMPLTVMQLLQKSEGEQTRQEIAEANERLRQMPRYKGNPELLKPWPAISPETRELVRKQLVERYSSSPYYQQRAKETGNEQQYWNEFSVGGIVHPRKT